MSDVRRALDFTLRQQEPSRPWLSTGTGTS